MDFFFIRNNLLHKDMREFFKNSARARLRFFSERSGAWQQKTLRVFNTLPTHRRSQTSLAVNSLKILPFYVLQQLFISSTEGVSHRNWREGCVENVGA